MVSDRTYEVIYGNLIRYNTLVIDSENIHTQIMNNIIITLEESSILATLPENFKQIICNVSFLSHLQG